jgi:hypothetical protein
MNNGVRRIVLRKLGNRKTTTQKKPSITLKKIIQGHVFSVQRLLYGLDKTDRSSNSGRVRTRPMGSMGSFPGGKAART